MNSLEFIEKEIKFLEDMINMDLALIEDEEDLKEIAKKQERLKHLQQIKTELEAWEVVKHSIYKRKMGEERYIQVMGGVYIEGQCWTSGINPYEILEKALEVKE